jgi:flagellin-like hook-associated protein FlgL
MSDNVTLTAAMRSNLLTLQNTTTNIGKIQNVLATGKKVNSALDDPTAFFAAQSLSNRSSDLSGLLDGMGQSIQTLQAADKAITSITTLVNQMKSVAQSAKDGAKSSVAATAYSKEFTVAQASDLVANGGLTASSTFTITRQKAGSADVAANTAALDATPTLEELRANIDAVAGVNATIVSGTTSGTVRLKIEATDASETLMFDDAVGSIASLGLTQADLTTTIADGGTAAPGTGAPADRATLEASFNAIRTQISEMVSDASYRGTNLLDGNNLITTFNEDGTSKYQVSGVDYTVGATGSRIGVTSADFSSLASIQLAIAQIDTSLNNMRADAKSFGNSLAIVQARQDFTTNMISNLKEGSDKLTLADTNEEGAKLLSLQTSQSLGINSTLTILE